MTNEETKKIVEEIDEKIAYFNHKFPMAKTPYLYVGDTQMYCLNCVKKSVFNQGMKSIKNPIYKGFKIFVVKEKSHLEIYERR